VKLPSLVEALEALGFAKEEIIRRLEGVKDRYPSGVIPLDFVVSLVRDQFSPAMVDAVIEAVSKDLVDMIQKGKGKIKRDDSALA